MTADVASEDGYYAVIPEWVIDADISAQAVRLYVVLRRYADKATLLAHPTRATLAERLKVKDEKVVDRAVKELSKIGALSVIPRWRDSEGDIAYARDDKHAFQTSNAYRLRRTAALPSAPPVGCAEAPRGGGAEATPRGAEKGDNQESVELQAVEPHTPQPPAARGAQEGAARGTLDFNRGRRRTTPPADPHTEEQPPKGETFHDAAEPIWNEHASAAFINFWAAYPRPEYPERALKVWNRKKLDRIADRVIAGAQRYAADPNRVEQYTASPTNWLEGGGWDNGPLPARAPQSRAEAEQQHHDGVFARAAERARTRDLDALIAVEGSNVRQIGGAW